MKQIDEAVRALACAIGFWRPSWILLEKLKNAKKKCTRQIPQGQYAYCNYLEIIRVRVFEKSINKWRRRRRRADSPPPHSGWRLENITTKWDVFQFEIIIKCLSQLFLIHLNTRFLCYGVYGGYLKPANVANFFQEFILTTAVKASLL